MATAASLHADRRNGRTYTAADRCRSGETSTHGGLTIAHLKRHRDLHLLDGRDPCREQAQAERRVGKAPSEMPSFQPYWGKPAIRNDRGDRGDVGIIRSPVRASILPDCGGCPAMGIPTAILGG